MATKKTNSKKRKKTNSKKSTKKVVSQSKKTNVKVTESKVATKPIEKKEMIIDNGSNSSNDKPKKEINFTKVLGNIFKVAVSVAVIAGFVWLNNTYIPKITGEEEFNNDDSQIVDVEESNADQLAAEAENLEFENQRVSINTNYGEIKASLTDRAAPQTTESFIRLTSRDYYNGQIFHRMVEGPTFSVIQGGDPDGTGTGGASAFGTPIPDELWSVEPETSEGENGIEITNDPQFSDPELYADFDKSTGTVKYRKGLLVMAKTAAPDSAGSQFFVTLNDTILPAQYTVFGVIDDESFSVLDKITDEVDPIDESESDTKDGRPNQEIKIESVELI